jgi:hypothetical protein
VEDKWWYSDKFGQVGPFTLKELKEALSTFGESRKRELWVWREGFSEWKAADFLNGLLEQNDVLPSQTSGATWLVAQATDAITRAGKSYWSRLADEFLRDKRDRMRTKELRATLRLPAKPALPPPLSKSKSVLLQCPTCRRPTSTGANSCPRCGEPLTQEWMDRELERLERAKTFGKWVGHLIGASFLIVTVLFIVGFFLPGQTRVTPIPLPRNWRVQESDVCALDWRGHLPEEDIRYLRKGC